MNDETQILSLSQVAQAVERTIQRDYPYSFLVHAEISKLNRYKYSGHCYPDLVEKKDGMVVAQMRAMIWERDYVRINKAFLDVLHEPLGEGIEVQCRARLSFDCVRGLSLVISDIDPTVSLGYMEREKRLCIERLKKEGLFRLNKERVLPLLPMRIAIISVDTSKGYCDFINTLKNDTHKFRFSTQLFVSLLQGDKASREIRNALDRIAQKQERFDCVAIIRGGGGDVGLGCYNDYDLCRAIATYPLPILTGIGH
ncbi:MAG: exodeoxyribonuclease VII large subunit, partial [Bacteroidales bacterium]|nr:exodeoxyribonuclease VII large subunit [Bacteroidales bacterium]